VIQVKQTSRNSITYIHEFFKIILVVLQSSQEAEARGQNTIRQANATNREVVVEAMVARLQERQMTV
jgi:hypothetical protein